MLTEEELLNLKNKVVSAMETLDPITVSDLPQILTVIEEILSLRQRSRQPVIGRITVAEATVIRAEKK